MVWLIKLSDISYYYYLRDCPLPFTINPSYKASTFFLLKNPETWLFRARRDLRTSNLSLSNFHFISFKITMEHFGKMKAYMETQHEELLSIVVKEMASADRQA